MKESGSWPPVWATKGTKREAKVCSEQCCAGDPRPLGLGGGWGASCFALFSPIPFALFWSLLCVAFWCFSHLKKSWTNAFSMDKCTAVSQQCSTSRRDHCLPVAKNQNEHKPKHTEGLGLIPHCLQDTAFPFGVGHSGALVPD